MIKNKGKILIIKELISLWRLTRCNLALSLILTAQLNFAQTSIHQEQSEYYRSLGLRSTAQFDSLNGFVRQRIPTDDTCSLRKMVFGYHPYWAGDQYLNYHWNLLSDLCFFSYEVDPATGYAETTHDWEIAPVIDTAKAHETRVHLCITSFRSHQLFFSNPQAQQQLISNTISLLKLRNADGVNLDFEAVPSSVHVAYNDFLVAFADSLHAAIPGCLVSMASPAVDWNNDLDIPRLSAHLDFFMIMAYDFYWNSSSTAGPVAGLFPMTADYNYSVARTVSWYLSQGAPKEKLVLGLPYYGRDWPVTNELAPSATTGQATALTYRMIRKNYTGYYSDKYRHFEPNSFANYYSYYENQWHQCFADDVHSFNRYYNLVNRFGLKGAGIWALGYDDGFSELWDMIRYKLSDCAYIVCEDSVYDAGGPAFGYVNNEDYAFSITIKPGDNILLNFDQLELDSSNDTLFVFDGPDEAFPLIFSLVAGSAVAPFQSSSNAVTFRFKSDNSGTASGWNIHYVCPSAGVEIPSDKQQISVYPNPFHEAFTIKLNSTVYGSAYFSITDVFGKQVLASSFRKIIPGENSFSLEEAEIQNLKPGLYFLQILMPDGNRSVVKLVKQ
jgi:spore germination protein YaaH